MVNGFRPANLAEALDILDKRTVRIIAGGTDLMVQNARGTGVSPKFSNPLLFISHLPVLKKIEVSNKYIKIGSCVTLSELLDSNVIPKTFKLAISQMASLPTRNIATLGGNIGNASPAADTLPFLYATKARIVTESNYDSNEIPIEDFISAPGKINLHKSELIKSISIPLCDYDLSFYKKVGTRKGMALSKLSFQGLANIKRNKLTDIRLAFGAVGPTVVRSEQLENNLKNLYLNDIIDFIPKIKQNYSKIITPINDSRSNKNYRLKTALELLDNFLKKIVMNNFN